MRVKLIVFIMRAQYTKHISLVAATNDAILIKKMYKKNKMITITLSLQRQEYFNMIKYLRIPKTTNYNTTNGQYNIRDNIINLEMFTSIKMRTRNWELHFQRTCNRFSCS